MNPKHKKQPSPITFLKDGRAYHINSEYECLTDFILNVPEHNYEADKVFCNHRNTVEKVSIGGREFVVKRYKRPTWANCVIYTFFRKNKAQRAYMHAVTLDEMGIDTPKPVAYITQKRYGLFHTGWFVSEYQPYVSLADIMTSPEYSGIKEPVLGECVKFTSMLHNKGVVHKDYNPNNILVHFSEESGKPLFSLIDINQMSIGKRPGIYESVISFLQNTMRIEDVLPAVRYYARLRNMPFSLCRFACYRFYVHRGIKRFIKKPVKKLVLAMAR